jgi:hypothetical protein
MSWFYLSFCEGASWGAGKVKPPATTPPQNAAKLSLLRAQTSGGRGLSALESAGHFEVRRVQIPSGTPSHKRPAALMSGCAFRITLPLPEDWPAAE